MNKADWCSERRNSSSRGSLFGGRGIGTGAPQRGEEMRFQIQDEKPGSGVS